MWTFVLDFGFIGFSSAACSTLFAEGTRSIYVFGWQPSRGLVVLACIAGIIIYPVGYLVFVFLKLSQLQSSGQVVYNSKFRKYTDRVVDAIKVKVDPPVPSWIPILSQIATRRISCAIPIKDERGRSVRFGEVAECRSGSEGDLDELTPVYGSSDTGASLDEFSRPFLPAAVGAPDHRQGEDGEQQQGFLLTEDVCRGRLYRRVGEVGMAEDELFALTSWLYERADEERRLVADYGGILRLVGGGRHGCCIVPEAASDEESPELGQNDLIAVSRGNVLENR
ncbi:phosphatidylinositol-4-phosphate 5-kinase-like protein 1 [Perkinsus olseni]|uniref:Phosphatidylinositol-4-phosphate 5-kinase-like protein 1 n=1 Tax=Perkinsus olseni TaxID=32597 RepID=A0A7J6ULX5_PEROL|nr:phosphatidylinositol-4-phosphate 5-kinase-like protein 1 [Perkinsus olseni]